jgi:hypothetical protein
MPAGNRQRDVHTNRLTESVEVSSRRHRVPRQAQGGQEGCFNNGWSLLKREQAGGGLMWREKVEQNGC